MWAGMAVPRESSKTSMIVSTINPLSLSMIHCKSTRFHERISTLSKESYIDSVLQKANIKQAIRVLITADLKQDELQTDMFSILTLLAVKGLNPHVYCLVEILTHEQKENALRAGADGIVETNKFASEYMQDCLSKGIITEAREQNERDGLSSNSCPSRMTGEIDVQTAER